VFVVPNPSGRNAAYPSFEGKLAWFVGWSEAPELTKGADGFSRRVRPARARESLAPAPKKRAKEERT